MTTSKTPLPLSELVQDWGGFEKLVATLHESGDVTVEHNVVLRGRSGASRQIDVLVRHRQGLYEHLIVVECKYRNVAVERIHVDALTTTIQEVGAAKGVIFSTKGFQSGAITQAKHSNIDLYQVRELDPTEWGEPGRHVRLWIQVLALSIGELSLPGALLVARTPTWRPTIRLEFGPGSKCGITPIDIPDKPHKTLEELLQAMARGAAANVYSPVRLKIDEGNEDDEGDARFVVPVNFEPAKPWRVKLPDGDIVAKRMSFKLGIKISQSRFQHDRAKGLAFALALEEFVSGRVFAASRRTFEEETHLALVGSTPAQEGEAPFVNDSILCVTLSDFVDFAEFAGVKPNDGPQRHMELKL